MMRLRYGDNFAGSTQAIALWRRDPARRRQGEIPSRGPCAGLGADRGDLQGHLHRRLRRLQGRRRSDLRAVRGGALRRLHHRGDVRPAGVSPRRCGGRGEEAAGIGRAVSGTRASGRRLFARQGAARDRAAARGRLRRADLSARRDGEDHALLSKPRHRARRAAPGQGREEGRSRRHHHAGAAVGHVRYLDAAFSRSGHRLRLGLDAGARPRAPARRRTAAGDLRSCRLGRADRDHRGHRRRRNLGHPWPGRRAGALVQDARALPRGRSIWSAMATRTSTRRRRPTRPRHEPLRRTARSSRLRARPQQQAAADHGLFSRHARSRPRLCAGRDDRRAVVQARQARADPRPDRRAHRSGAVRAVL